MALEKLMILVETGPNQSYQPIEVLFNPNQITIQKSSRWKRIPAAERDVPAAQFTYGEPATLSMDLFFDTYEDGTDVRRHTSKIFHLMTVENHGEFHRPPLCKLLWGNVNFDNYMWILQTLNQRFTLFLDNGSPVRATLSCTFRQWRSDEEEAKILDTKSADVAKTHIVRRAETLSSIAAAEYQDPARWRPIAEANNIDNPRDLSPGQSLTIPTVRGGGRA